MTALGATLGAVDPQVFDLLCALCFSTYASAEYQLGARCGNRTEKMLDGCAGKLIAIEPRGAKPPRRGRRKAVTAAGDEAPSREGGAAGALSASASK